MQFTKLMWMKDHRPEEYARIYKVLGVKEYIVQRLTGRFGENDFSDAYAAGMMNINTSASTGVHTIKTSANLAFIINARINPKISMTGPRVMGRVPPTRAFCITVISVVIRVIREEVSK